jgi:hypothetical protein
MSGWLPLWTAPNGTQTFFKDNLDGTYTVWSTQENDPFLEQNKAMANHNDGWSESRDIRRAASIPLSLIEHWKQTEGWNPLDHNYHDRLKKRLNDGDYQHLRTAHWTV